MKQNTTKTIMAMATLMCHAPRIRGLALGSGQVLIDQPFLSKLNGLVHNVDEDLPRHILRDEGLGLFKVPGVRLELVFLAPFEVPFQKSLLGKGPHAEILFHNLGRQQFPLGRIGALLIKQLHGDQIDHSPGPHRDFRPHILHAVGGRQRQDDKKENDGNEKRASSSHTCHSRWLFAFPLPLTPPRFRFLVAQRIFFLCGFFRYRDAVRIRAISKNSSCSRTTPTTFFWRVTAMRRRFSV